LSRTTSDLPLVLERTRKVIRGPEIQAHTKSPADPRHGNWAAKHLFSLNRWGRIGSQGGSIAKE
jgi:hypothetical protein